MHTPLRSPLPLLNALGSIFPSQSRARQGTPSPAPLPVSDSRFPAPNFQFSISNFQFAFFRIRPSPGLGAVQEGRDLRRLPFAPAVLLLRRLPELEQLVRDVERREDRDADRAAPGP